MNSQLVVYRITNLRNKRIYIGSTGNFEARKSEHIGQLRQRKHCNRFLQLDFDTYKEPAFVFEVIQDDFKNREQMYLKEYELILKHKGNTYNIDTNCPVLKLEKGKKRKPLWNLGSGMIVTQKNKRQPDKKKVKGNYKIVTEHPALDAIAEKKRMRLLKVKNERL